MNRIRHHIAYPPRQIPAKSDTRVTGAYQPCAARGLWSDTEKALLAKIYPATPNGIIMERTGRSRNSIEAMANQMGVRKSTHV